MGQKWIAIVDWDEEGKQAGLPYCVNIPKEFNRDIAEETEHGYLESIGKWLSDEYGYCHYGFEVRPANR